MCMIVSVTMPNTAEQHAVRLLPNFSFLSPEECMLSSAPMLQRALWKHRSHDAGFPPCKPAEQQLVSTSC